MQRTPPSPGVALSCRAIQELANFDWSGFTYIYNYRDKCKSQKWLLSYLRSESPCPCRLHVCREAPLYSRYKWLLVSACALKGYFCMMTSHCSCFNTFLLSIDDSIYMLCITCTNCNRPGLLLKQYRFMYCCSLGMCNMQLFFF